MGKSASKEPRDITTTFNNSKKRKETLDKVLGRVQQFSPKLLKTDILSWMRNVMKDEHKCQCSLLRISLRRQFEKAFMQLLECLDTKFYADMMHQICYSLQITPLDFQDRSIRKKLLHVCLRTAFDCEGRGESSEKFSLFKEFFDCWVLIENKDTVEKVFHLIDFCTVEAPEPESDPEKLKHLMFCTRKKFSQLQRTNQKIFRGFFQGDVISAVRYMEDGHYLPLDEATQTGLCETLSQIISEAKMISSFLFELVYYLFDFISIQQNAAEDSCLRELITRYLFSQNSSLLSLSLYLVRILNSREHDIFTRKKAWLSKQEDARVLNPSVEKKLKRGIQTVVIGFKDDLSKLRRDLNKRLVEALRVPSESYSDIVSRMRLMAVYLEDLPRRDHYFLAFWAEILEAWIAGSFEDIELDVKIELFHMIIKYLDSNEVLIFALAIEKLHHERLVDHQFFHLFIGTMKTELEIHAR